MATRVDEARMVGLLAGAWDAEWDDRLHREVHPSCCILAARTGIEVLRTLGVKAWPVATEVTVFNRPAAELFAAGNRDVANWPPFAWSIHVGRHSPGNGYPGHLWLATEQFLVDLSARQFHRPGLLRFDKSIILPNELPNVFTQDDGTMMMVQPSRDRTYRRANDWLHNWRELVPRVLERADAIREAIEDE